MNDRPRQDHQFIIMYMPGQKLPEMTYDEP